MGERARLVLSVVAMAVSGCDAPTPGPEARHRPTARTQAYGVVGLQGVGWRYPDVLLRETPYRVLAP